MGGRSRQHFIKRGEVEALRQNIPLTLEGKGSNGKSINKLINITKMEGKQAAKKKEKRGGHESS